MAMRALKAITNWQMTRLEDAARWAGENIGLFEKGDKQRPDRQSRTLTNPGIVYIKAFEKGRIEGVMTKNRGTKKFP